MLVPQVAVHLHRQGAAVLVPQPSAHGGDIDPGFDAARSEKVPQIVVGNADDPNGLTGACQCALAFANPHHRIRSGRLGMVGLESPKQRRHIRHDGHPPDLHDESSELTL